jgi:hypothetical protein
MEKASSGHRPSYSDWLGFYRNIVHTGSAAETYYAINAFICTFQALELWLVQGSQQFFLPMRLSRYAIFSHNLGEEDKRLFWRARYRSKANLDQEVLRLVRYRAPTHVVVASLDYLATPDIYLFRGL